MPIYVITGANRGLGLEFCRQLSADASNIIIAGTRSLSSDLSDLEALNGNKNVHVLVCDTSDHSSIESFAKNVTNKIGSGLQINYLINNAGTNTDRTQTSKDISQKVFLEELNTNVLGPAKVTQALNAHIQKGSVVMNISSCLGSVAKSKMMVATRCTTYSISKAALNMLTVHQAHDYGKGGNGAVVICVDPGWVKTRMGGEGAVLMPAESIEGMLKVLHRASEADAAKYYLYNGEEVPW
ncbi:MAG: hypothetical protein LQ347_001373 [Umbilicaria vellea]|nr:MAG: hypothetical protein LQ347_001373 [Umbilicaria vellea]